VYATEANETAFQAALATGVVHFPETAKPGEFGNVYLFGHSSDYAWSKGAYKTVFALLTKIQPGTEILVSDSVGDLFTYKVKEAFVAGSKDVKYLSQEKYEKKLLTLQTSYPIGTALKRYIVRAEILPQK
jgi:LPXTG-site transpeptidase (sortase) family protein